LEPLYPTAVAIRRTLFDARNPVVVGPTMVDIVDIDKLLLGIYAFNR
jgi:hypothetical protein